MPCSSCTTGSPMRTSDRSRSIASTFERRAGVALAAAHDVRVELGLGDEREPRAAATRSPHASGAAVSASFASPATNSREARRRRRAARRTRRSTAASSRGARRFRRRSARARRASSSDALQRRERIVGAAVDLHATAGGESARRARTRGLRVSAIGTLDAREAA